MYEKNMSIYGKEWKPKFDGSFFNRMLYNLKKYT
jgi:hypothetical protein